LIRRVVVEIPHYLGAGVQVEETELDSAFGNRGNDGESVFFEMLLRGNKMDLDFDH
jgi:hypothetical protein